MQPYRWANSSHHVTWERVKWWKKARWREERKKKETEKKQINLISISSLFTWCEERSHDTECHRFFIESNMWPDLEPRGRKKDELVQANQRRKKNEQKKRDKRHQFLWLFFSSLKFARFFSLTRPHNIYHFFSLSLPVLFIFSLHNLWQILFHSLVRHLLTLFSGSSSECLMNSISSASFFSLSSRLQTVLGHMWYLKHFSFCRAIFSWISSSLTHLLKWRCKRRQ